MEGMQDILQNEYGVKPVIQEMVRTDVCFPAIRLLVEHNMVVPAGSKDPDKPLKAFRLQVGDGEYCMAGRYLAIRDFYTIGFTELPRLIRVTQPTENANERPVTPSGGEGYGTDLDSVDLLKTPDKDGAGYETSPSPPPSFDPTPVEDTVDDEGGSISDTRIPDDSVSRDAPKFLSSPLKPSEYEKDTLVPRSIEWIRRASVEHHHRCHSKTNVAFSDRCPTTDGLEFERYCQEHSLADNDLPCRSVSHCSLLAMMKGSPLKPFRDIPRIVSLASVTGRNKSRNHDVDVLGVIESIDESTTKPAKLGTKRDIRILDPSVDEPVTLSVFVDPVNFHAKPGTFALFRHVTTHDWRRGNLCAYPARVLGKEWFIPNPWCEPLGIRNEAQRMQEWWEEHEVLKHVSPPRGRLGTETAREP
ncbi:uncharacterized protein KY384_005617 [Bacidia gigantensis]|uniref:uncharacterized protein n=1 Tax=Bacidia gigantensis TaxID=2732470 RepID=UPI001D050CFE|nr:uncharacterized protein KY384_005617 [Bacidia gigantensis]KAG8530134.1 hypothetical protein KY384_005617 [Bacidia gigantensis]